MPGDAHDGRVATQQGLEGVKHTAVGAAYCTLLNKQQLARAW